MLNEIESKLSYLVSKYEEGKSNLSEKEIDLIESYFVKIRSGIEKLKNNNFTKQYEKDGNITSIKIFMNKIYEIVEMGDKNEKID